MSHCQECTVIDIPPAPAPAQLPVKNVAPLPRFLTNDPPSSYIRFSCVHNCHQMICFDCIGHLYFVNISSLPYIHYIQSLRILAHTRTCLLAALTKIRIVPAEKKYIAFTAYLKHTTEKQHNELDETKKKTLKNCLQNCLCAFICIMRSSCIVLWILICLFVWRI